MGKINPANAKTVIRKLKKLGFVEVHQRGSHVYLKSETTQKVVIVATHGSRDIPTGTLYSIVIKQAGLTADQFNEA